jgi:hypothetical protein
MNKESDFEKDYAKRMDDCNRSLMEFLNSKPNHPSIWCGSLTLALFKTLKMCDVDKERSVLFFDRIKEEYASIADKGHPCFVEEKKENAE